MNDKISVFVTCVEAIIYLISQNLQDCIFRLKILQVEALSNLAGVVAAK